MTYGHPVSINIDPIEKKPLYHFLPGSEILSIATAGCNLHCKNCQNWSISQPEELSYRSQPLLPDKIVEMALQRNCPSIAYTYTEPLVSYEYTYDCCNSAFDHAIRNVLVTAAYINPEPLRKICRFVDAANVDLKAFSDDFYRRVCSARLAPVLRALEIMKECGVMLEITNLVIPTLNDSDDDIRRLCDWVSEKMSVDTPLHFSRFYPQHKLNHLPPTPRETLLHARSLAFESGLRFVYIGNISDREGESTWCPECGALLIDRSGYQILSTFLQDGRCMECSMEILGIWK